jgi:hypothetical protein
MSDSQQLKFSENLNFCNTFLDKARAAAPETLVNALIDLSLMLIQGSALPGTDDETKKVLAVFMADQALERSVTDFEKLIDDAELENKSFELVAG